MDVDGQEEPTPSTSTTITTSPTTGGATPSSTGATPTSTGAADDDEPKPKLAKKRSVSSAKVKKEPESNGAGSTDRDSNDTGE